MRKLFAAAALVLCVTGSAWAETRPVMSANADIDGDGKKDKVWISSVKSDKGKDGYSILHVGSAEARLEYDDYHGFEIVDIDRSDKYKEIDLWGGAGEVTDHDIYWYDGKTIHKMSLQLYWHMNYLGNGIVLNTNWTGYLFITEKYVLDKKTRELDLVPQEMYAVGDEGDGVKVLKSFPIYYSRTSKDVVANLERNSRITVLVYVPAEGDLESDCPDMNSWLLIKTQYGLLGWVQLKTLDACTDRFHGAG